MNKTKIGIIRETKNPPDSRVPLTPLQCSKIMQDFTDVEIVVQPSPSRCYKDEEYAAAGISLTEDLSDCDVLLGVKEVKAETLIANKTYFFFSHTIKEQPYNRSLLKSILEKTIQLIDYEVLTNESGRVIAFGRWAGIVGAHNGIREWGMRTKAFELKPMHLCFDFEEAKSYYSKIDLGRAKIVLTGTGRVSNGAKEVLDLMQIREVSAEEFLTKGFDEAVYCQLATEQMFAKGADNFFDNNFYKDPSGYHSIFEPYTRVADIMINGIYWDNRAPAFFSKDDMKKPEFSIRTIADITCDIAPVASIPSTLRATVIGDAVFGYNPLTEKEEAAYQLHVIDMMTVDNLPNELPRDASEDFGNQFIKYVLPELLKDDSDMIYRASITQKSGKLNKPFLYLTNYVNA
jgi:saccharopine dehydrogenase (NAD+, L-lysine forming)